MGTIARGKFPPCPPPPPPPKRVVVVVRVVVNVVCVRFSSSIFCTHDVEFSPLLRIHKPPPRPLMMNNTSQRRGGRSFAAILKSSPCKQTNNAKEAF